MDHRTPTRRTALAVAAVFLSFAAPATASAAPPADAQVEALVAARDYQAIQALGPEVMPEALATELLQRALEPCPSPDRRLRWSLVGALALPGDRSERAMDLFERAMRALARGKLQPAPQAGSGLSLS